MTLEQIFTYANTLTEDAFATLDDCIEFLNEAQDIICRWQPVQAAPVSYDLTSNEVTLPADFMKLHKATLDDVAYFPPSAPWSGVLTLETSLVEGTLKIWYYKTPSVLVSSTPSQVPDVHEMYHRSMASYAAKMFNLIDDDPGLRDTFRNEFYGIISAMKVSSGIPIHYTNY
jgi:hypothetical protein